MTWLPAWAGGGLLLLFSTTAAAAGLWNLPTTSRQYWGVGYGAGYHAPLVVANPWRGTAASPGVSRVPIPLWPHEPGVDALRPSSLVAGGGGGLVAPPARHNGAQVHGGGGQQKLLFAPPPFAGPLGQPPVGGSTEVPIEEYVPEPPPTYALPFRRGN